MKRGLFFIALLSIGLLNRNCRSGKTAVEKTTKPAAIIASTGPCFPADSVLEICGRLNYDVFTLKWKNRSGDSLIFHDCTSEEQDAVNLKNMRLRFGVADSTKKLKTLFSSDRFPHGPSPSRYRLAPYASDSVVINLKDQFTNYRYVGSSEFLYAEITYAYSHRGGSARKTSAAVFRNH